jgi:tagatose 1,6-diphosphate aldolase
MGMIRTDFLNPAVLRDRDLELHVRQWCPANLPGYAPAYHFNMLDGRSSEVVGNISLRLGDSDYLVRYCGQIGYGVKIEHRGRHYAARACRLLFPLALSHGLDPLWITCNPDNLASRRTCELAGGRFVEIVDLPEDCDMYLRGERQKCRYRFDIGA